MNTFRTALSLIELVVVLAIIAVLCGLLLPAIQKVRAAAATKTCAARLRQAALAVHLYESNRRHLPAGCAYPYARGSYDIDRQIGMSWHTAILPFVEQDALAANAEETHRIDPGGNDPRHQSVRAAVVSVFLCPTEPRRTGTNLTTENWGLTSYVGVAGRSIFRFDGIFHKNVAYTCADVTDGLSNTLMIGERVPGQNGRNGGWYAAWGNCVCPIAQILSLGATDWEPTGLSGCQLERFSFHAGVPESDCDSNHFWSRHPNGANFALADGSVRFFSYGAAEIMPALATRAGGEGVEVP